MTAVWTRASVFGGLVVLFSVTACGGERRAVSTPTPRGPQTLAIIAREYKLQTTGTRRLLAGLTRITFRNRGRRGHALGVWRLKAGVSFKHFLQQARVDNAAALVSPRGGIRYLPPGGTWEMTTRLARGRYVLIDYQQEGGVENWRRGALRSLRVGPRRAQAAPPPRTTYTIRMRDFAFVMQRPRQVLHGSVIRVINEGRAEHEISLLRLAKGKTVLDGLRAVRALDEGVATALPGQPFELLGLVAPGWVGYVRAALKPGRYLLLSFARDRTGKTDTERGMFSQLNMY